MDFALASDFVSSLAGAFFVSGFAGFATSFGIFFVSAGFASGFATSLAGSGIFFYPQVLL